jgi:hypothetical protein
MKQIFKNAIVGIHNKKNSSRIEAFNNIGGRNRVMIDLEFRSFFGWAICDVVKLYQRPGCKRYTLGDSRWEYLTAVKGLRNFESAMNPEDKAKVCEVWSILNKGGLSSPKEALRAFGERVLQIIVSSTKIDSHGCNTIKVVHDLLFKTFYSALKSEFLIAWRIIWIQVAISLPSTLSEVEILFYNIISLK